MARWEVCILKSFGGVEMCLQVKNFMSWKARSFENLSIKEKRWAEMTFHNYIWLYRVERREVNKIVNFFHWNVLQWKDVFNKSLPDQRFRGASHKQSFFQVCHKKKTNKENNRESNCCPSSHSDTMCLYEVSFVEVERILFKCKPQKFSLIVCGNWH